VSTLKYTLNKHVIGGARIERLRYTDLAVFQPVDAYQLSRTGHHTQNPQAMKIFLIGVRLSFRGQLDEICPHSVSDLRAL
jgi:hypothetical protein